MFTGIVEEKGKIARVEFMGREKRFTLELPLNLTDVQLGDSINVNGACLTVTEKSGSQIKVDLSLETLEKTNLGEMREGEKVNLERALRLSDRLGGHIVTGHIDGVGVISGMKKEREFLDLSIRIPEALVRYVVPKGSIALDGTSLTVNECRGDQVRLTLIPFTLEKTILIDKKIGDRVNIETDIIGKYVEKLLDQRSGKSGIVSLAFLKEQGYIKSE
jgi:riboflavin synthase